MSIRNSSVPELQLSPEVRAAVSRHDDARKRSNVACKLTELFVVECGDTKYKLRRYRSLAQAQRIASLLKPVRHLFPPFYGRVVRHLIFAYVDGAESCGTSILLRGIGTFLARLRREGVGVPYSHEITSLCEWLKRGAIFRHSTISLIRQRCEAISPMRIPYGLEYMDAMPWNFVLSSGNVIPIDEKHLRVAPLGASLIKPLLKLSAKDFTALYDGYRAAGCEVALHDEQVRWALLTYYHLYSLYVHVRLKPVAVNLAISAFHERREALLGLIGAPWHQYLAEVAPWRVKFYVLGFRRYLRRSLRKLGSFVIRYGVKRVSVLRCGSK